MYSGKQNKCKYIFFPFFFSFECWNWIFCPIKQYKKILTIFKGITILTRVFLLFDSRCSNFYFDCKPWIVFIVTTTLNLICHIKLLFFLYCQFNWCYSTRIRHTFSFPFFYSHYFLYILYAVTWKFPIIMSIIW